MRSLEETQVWNVSGGVAAPVVMVPLQNLPPTDLTLPAPSNGESEVGASKEELPTPKHLLSKVWLSDEVEHMLDKGAWAMTLAMCIRWKIFVDVSRTFLFCVGLALIVTCLGSAEGVCPMLSVLPGPPPRVL